MAERARMSAEIPWQECESAEDDHQFEELQDAIASGKVRHGQYKASDCSIDSSDEDEKDHIEPSESEPGKRLLWSAQKNRVDILSSILEQDSNLVKFADEDGYTALHR